MNRTLELQQPKVVSLAEFRRHVASDDEHPPPPRPVAAARQSPPPTNTEAIGWTNLARGRLVFAA